MDFLVSTSALEHLLHFDLLGLKITGVESFDADGNLAVNFKVEFGPYRAKDVPEGTTKVKLQLNKYLPENSHAMIQEPNLTFLDKDQNVLGQSVWDKETKLRIFKMPIPIKDVAPFTGSKNVKVTITPDGRDL